MKKLSLLAIPLLLLSGCTSEEPLQQNDSGPKVPLVVESVSVSSHVATRAESGFTDLDAGKHFALFLEGVVADSYTKMDKVVYTKKDDGTIGPVEGNEAIYLGAKDANVCAYYLPELSITDKTAYTLTTNYYNEANDLVYAKDQTVNGTIDRNSVTFNMLHAYAQIELNFKRENYPSICNITTFSLKNSTLAKTASLNLATGELGITEVETSQLFYTNPTDHSAGITIDKENDTNKINLLVVPCDLTNTSGTGLSVVFNVENKEMTMNIPHGTLSAFKAGTKYKITANLKGTGITGSTVQVAQWEENRVGDYEPMP